ncbi:response regulator [Paenibacillus sp. MMS20-IR301]|uniref:response regulator n=1 Tax=Paenibacillus sp. MMS20-IR301 TaxID=2895946 RepID=UPI0028E3191D|nr:response regulator [Paenibacillus sp. MMS20-IR301]WNS40815.1 response regulator [Paenibacillus sp. MMS20-IR301]
MIKAVVFDDEIIVLKGLERLIKWEEYGVVLAGTATDGLSALEMFRELKPEIVMTDIRMPGIDGLTLIEMIRNEAPETMFIVFTGFNEYSYVKQALKIGVVDYLEKPVTITTIREGIKKAVQKIHELDELSEMKQKWKLGMLEKVTINFLLSGYPADPSAIEDLMKHIGEDSLRVKGVTVLISTAEIANLELENSRVIGVKNGVDYVYLILHFSDQAIAWLDDWNHKSDASIGLGRTYSSLSEAPLSYIEAKRALKYCMYLEEGGITTFESIHDVNKVLHGFNDMEEEVFIAMRLGNLQGMTEKLDLLLEALRKGRPTAESAETQMQLLYFHGLEICKETGGNLEELKPLLVHSQLDLREAGSLEELIACARKEMLTMMKWISKVRSESKHGAIKKSLEYIRNHYCRDLSQSEVANHVEMNTTYFSLLFKEEAGISYIKFLTRLRMEKAKEFLNEGKTITEITEQVGYHHARHFSETFKRYTGMTPGQYREVGKRT